MQCFFIGRHLSPRAKADCAGPQCSVRQDHTFGKTGCPAGIEDTSQCLAVARSIANRLRFCNKVLVVQHAGRCLAIAGIDHEFNRRALPCYFGAGLGIILLAVVQIMGFSPFNVANSLKNLLATTFTLISIVVFGVGGVIAWPEAYTMMIGSALGGYMGGRFARLVDEFYLRASVIAFGCILSAVYFSSLFLPEA